MRSGEGGFCITLDLEPIDLLTNLRREGETYSGVVGIIDHRDMEIGLKDVPTSVARCKVVPPSRDVRFAASWAARRALSRNSLLQGNGFARFGGRRDAHGLCSGELPLIHRIVGHCYAFPFVASHPEWNSPRDARSVLRLP